MCLNRVDKKPTVTEGEGWKVLERLGDGGLCTPYKGVAVEVGHWIRDTNDRSIMSLGDGPYQTGFHLFRTREGARHFHCPHSGERVCRVSFRDVTATGKQGGHDSIVARKIYIHPKGKK